MHAPKSPTIQYMPITFCKSARNVDADNQVKNKQKKEIEQHGFHLFATYVKKEGSIIMC